MVELRKRILNVGCGIDTYGTDFIDMYPMRPEVRKVNLAVQKLPYPDKTFEEVYGELILENIYDPVFFLKEVRRVLKDDGKFVLIAINAGFSGWATNSSYGVMDHMRDGYMKGYMLYTTSQLRKTSWRSGVLVWL